MRTFYFFTVVILFIPLVKAQTIPHVFSDEENEIIDNLIYDNSLLDLLNGTANKNFISFNVQYNHKTFFSGRDIGIQQYSLIPQVSYMHANGIFTSVSGLYYERLSPNWDYTAITLGYGKRFGKNKKFWWSASFDRYFFSRPANNPFKNALNTGFGIGNKKKTFGTDLSVGLLFGDGESIQLISATYLELLLYSNKKKQLLVRPQLSFEIGQQTIQLARTIVYRGRTFTIVDAADDFGFLNTQLEFPLQYSVANFDFEIGYVFNFPSPLRKEGSLNSTDTFIFSIAYLFAF